LLRQVSGQLPRVEHEERWRPQPECLPGTRRVGFAILAFASPACGSDSNNSVDGWISAGTLEVRPSQQRFSFQEPSA
jgi:hypothetical protein